MRKPRIRSLLSIIVKAGILAAIALSTLPINGRATVRQDADFHIGRRVNAHGDEFNSVAFCNGGQNLIIGTEKGEVLVTNTADGHVIRRLDQPSPVHAVVALNNDHQVIAAGGYHSEGRRSSAVRKWNLDDGTFVDWVGMKNTSVIALTTDASRTLVAAASITGQIVVWEASTGKQIATWELAHPTVGLAIIDRTVYAVLVDEKADIDGQTNSIVTLSIDRPLQAPAELIAKNDHRLWLNLSAAPDGQVLATSRYDNPEGVRRVVLVNPQTGAEVENYDGQSIAWFASDGIVLFDEAKPQKTILLQHGKAVSTTDWAKGGGWHGNGNPGDLSGLAVAPDGKTAWGVYRNGAALVKWQQQDSKGQILYATPGLVFALDVFDRADGSTVIATGGDDGFVRFWNPADYSIKREFRTSVGVPHGLALLPDGHNAVYSYGDLKSSTAIILVNLDTGDQKKLLTVNQPAAHVQRAVSGFVYDSAHRLILADTGGHNLREFKLDNKVEEFDISANGQWLVAADDKNTLYLFEIATGRQIRKKETKSSDLKVVVNNDGTFVYLTDFETGLSQWNTKTDVIKQLEEIQGQAASLNLSVDETRVLIGGNQRDVQIYDASSGKSFAAFETPSCNFYVTNVWLKGDRLIFTTDTGVLFDGVIKK